MKGIVVDLIMFILFLFIIFSAILFMYIQITSKFRVYQIKFGEKELADLDSAYRGSLMAVSSSLYFSSVNGIQDYLNGIDPSPEDAIKKWLVVTNTTMRKLSSIYQNLGAGMSVQVYPDTLVLDMENGTASVKYRISIDLGYAWLNDTEYMKMLVPEIRKIDVPKCSGHEENGDIVVDVYGKGQNWIICGAYNKSLPAGYVEYDYNGRINRKQDLLGDGQYTRKVERGFVVWKKKFTI